MYFPAQSVVFHHVTLVFWVGPLTYAKGVPKWVVALEVILWNKRTYTSIGSTQSLKMNVDGECMYVCYA